MDWLIADGAYSSIERTEVFSRANVTPVTHRPPTQSCTATRTRWHDQIVN